MGGFTLTFLASWNIRLNLDAGAPADVQFFLPEVSWYYYALFTVLILAAVVLLLRRLVAAWKQRR
jgi:hypothetical protein